MSLRIEPITKANAHVHLNLAQIYEAAFAPLTHALPDKDGLFIRHTTLPVDGCFGYLAYHNDLPGGFVVCSYQGETLMVEEMFVCPHLRRQRVASDFLGLVAKRHPGLWDIRQLAEADRSRAFWRWWARQMDPGYTEDTLIDEKWGSVTRQLVSIRPEKA